MIRTIMGKIRLLIPPRNILHIRTSPVCQSANRGGGKKTDIMGDKNKQEIQSLFVLDDHAKDYQEYRPAYPDELWKSILSFCQGTDRQSRSSLAIDIGCGSGQGTLPLAPHFDRVIGVDVSDAQLKAAPRTHLNVEFRLGFAENLTFLEDASVDLVCCGAAFHWMDAQKLYAEVRRVLKPGGALAIYTYSHRRLDLDTPDATELLEQMHREVHAYQHKGSMMAYELYKDVILPFEDFKREEGFAMKSARPLSALEGFLYSLSPWRKMLKAEPERARNLLREFRENMLKLYTGDNIEGSLDPTVHLNFPMVLLLGRRK